VIRLFVVGRLRAKWAQLADEDYQRRISRLARLDVVEIADADPKKEGRQILDRLGQEPLVACDPEGELWSSKDLSRRLGADGSLSFCVGGPDGLSGEVRARARESFAFGRITLPHELARVVLLEQIYRGLTILRGHPYHR
jgi:23S rRNA (pseudouridine1915-N3)-methyltransferase